MVSARAALETGAKKSVANVAPTRTLAPRLPKDSFSGDPGGCRKRALLDPRQLVTVSIALSDGISWALRNLHSFAITLLAPASEINLGE
jgi:hypothetical protein